MQTLSTLAGVQVRRAAAFPEKFADNPVRSIALDTLQRRNAAIDAAFYDVGAITPEETPRLAFWLAREGAIVLVPPSGQGALQVFLEPEAFFAAGVPVAALAVAGVGSSALGAAAFARNVADVLEAPVAAVVSGYGLADVMTEALGGYFWFGTLNSIRHLFEPLDAATKLFTRSEHAAELSSGAVWARTSKDTRTVVALLSDPRFQPALLIGHSKGNLVISEALYALATDPDQEALTAALARRLRIVTVSAKIGMPPPFRQVLDVIGQWDWFGALNSRPDLEADYTVPRAWHSTNPEFPLGLGIDVKAALRHVLPMFDRPRPAGKAAVPVFADLSQRATAALAAATLHGRAGAVPTS
ncbi:hypothetical protein [Rhodoplanes sp. SY1]|uniref:hypothetical protein n=1 Tax=Rhodoplanes sp. SY1 TaxID=3166646 RepID=UPI0038B4686F